MIKTKEQQQKEMINSQNIQLQFKPLLKHQLSVSSELKYKQFQLDNFKVKYSNNCQMLQLSQGEQINNKLTINNHLCQAIGDVMTKVSDIKIGSKVVRITDYFSIQDIFNMQLNDNLDPQNLLKKIKVHQYSQKEQEQVQAQGIHRKKHIIKKKPYIPGYNNKDKDKNNNNHSKDDKPMIYKNTVKNLVRLFIHWLKQSSIPQKTYLLKKLQSLTQQTNYNNQLILLIASTTKLCQKFLQFIENSATDSIKNSKIIQKQSHINSLQFYKKVFKEQLDKKKRI